MIKLMIKLLLLSLILVCGLFPVLVLAAPTSTNYELKNYGFGNGGTDGSSSTSYSLYGIAGEQSGDKASSTSYGIGQGVTFTQQANLPLAPTVANENDNTTILRITIDNGDNPTDAEFAIAISTDNFVSDTRYVQDDQAIGSTLGNEDWQTYTAWGGASGFQIIGLSPGTTYYVKVAARRGNFTQSAYSAVGQNTTSTPSLSFDIDVNSANTETSPPFITDLGNLIGGTIATAADKIWIDLDTNADSGADVYVNGLNSGLTSTSVNYTIVSATANLTAATEGYGLKGSSVAQTAGGPLQLISPYNGSSENVGVVDTSLRQIFDTNNLAVSGARGSILVKAKASTVTPAASDYSDNLIFTAVASF